MSVLIKGMKMPERCEGCLMYRHSAEYDYAYCCISSVNVLGHGNARLNNCPLVEVPTPHGRLIDADEIIEVQMFDEMYEEWTLKIMSVAEYLAFAADLPPTIIEAEEGDPDVSAD